MGKRRKRDRKGERDQERHRERRERGDVRRGREKAGSRGDLSMQASGAGERLGVSALRRQQEQIGF